MAAEVVGHKANALVLAPRPAGVAMISHPSFPFFQHRTLAEVDECERLVTRFKGTEPMSHADRHRMRELLAKQVAHNRVPDLSEGAA